MTGHRRPLHVRLTEEFRARITRGDWTPGSHLPSEAELVREFDASRGTVRQALAVLRSEGVVVGGRGKPPRVRDVPPAQPFTTLMSFTEWAHSIGATPGQRLVEMARRACPENIAHDLGLEPGEQVVQLLRQRLLDERPAMVERTTFVLDVGMHLFTFDTDSGSIYAHLLATGVDLARGRHTIDAVAADELDADLLGVEVGAPLLRVRRLTFTADDHAVEYSDDRYLPGRTTFTIENSIGHGSALFLHPTEEAS